MNAETTTRSTTSTVHPIRVLIGKAGLDGHDRGAKAVAVALRDAGFEVIYTGVRHRPEEIVSIAVQEDVDVIGISLLSGAHIEVMQELRASLDAAGADDILVLLGGNVPTRDHEVLRSAGVDAIFPTSSKFTDIVEWITTHVHQARQEGAG